MAPPAVSDGWDLRCAIMEASKGSKIASGLGSVKNCSLSALLRIRFLAGCYVVCRIWSVNQSVSHWIALRPGLSTVSPA